METRFVRRNIFQRILGISATCKPKDSGCWTYSDGKLIIDLRRAPELDKRGDGIRLEGGGLPEKVLVISGEDGKFRAFRNRCTHLGHRRLDPVPGTNTVQCCSVNKSTYDYDGIKIHGPAPKPLVAYPAETEGDKLVVSMT